MQLNALHIRFALIGLGVLFVIGLIIYGGGSLDAPAIVQVDFSMYPEEFEGLQVEIDGEIVGRLQAYGATNRTGFEVDEGVHSVRVIAPDVPCIPQQVRLEGPTRKVRLLLDYEDRADSRGAVETVMSLRL